MGEAAIVTEGSGADLKDRLGALGIVPEHPRPFHAVVDFWLFARICGSNWTPLVGARSDGASLAFREKFSRQGKTESLAQVCGLRRRNLGADPLGQKPMNLSHGEIQHASRNLEMPVNKGRNSTNTANPPTDSGEEAKRTWGSLKGIWVPHDTRDAIVDYVHYWSDRAETPAKQILAWAGLVDPVSSTTGNNATAKSTSTTDWCPATGGWKTGNNRPSSISILAGTFYYMCSILDDCSRAIVHWEIREAMKEVDVEIILQRAGEKHPDAHPRIITDNGPQFIARDFKEFLRIAGMTHVKTSPYYPQSNGKIERYHRTIQGECLRFHSPLSLDEVRRLVEDYVRHDNEVRLHSGIGYLTPLTKLEGRDKQVFAQRDRKLEEARERRKANRQTAAARAIA